MNFSPCRCSEPLFDPSEVARYAIVDIDSVDDRAAELYDRWIAEGRHAGMDYLTRYPDVRRNPELLLPGARSMICCAIPYPSPLELPRRHAGIAAYALGTDYHQVVRDILSRAARRLESLYGCRTRVCVDTAPLRERYWACRAGLGIIGLNNHLIIPELGSCFFLGEILTTARLEPTAPPHPAPPADCGRCGRCGRCVEACPTGAIGADGSFDARRCLSYLTIEHRGDWPDRTDLHGHLYGCDVCAAVCPHNASHRSCTPPPELRPRPELLRLSVDEVASMDQQGFSSLFAHSAIKRAKLAGLQRNARAIIAARHADD